MNGMNGLGDVQDPSLRRTLQQWGHLGRHRWIVNPDWNPPPSAAGETPAQHLEGHVLPRLWQLLADYYELLKTGVFRVQKPGWLEAPFSALPEDLCTETAVALANGTETVVLSYQVPDRHVAAFDRFGHLLTDATQWGTVIWTIRVNRKPVRTYHSFRQQRGSFIDPTPMAQPLKLKGKDLLEVVAIGGATAVSALVRLPGWLISAASITQDGTALDWNVR